MSNRYMITTENKLNCGVRQIKKALGKPTKAKECNLKG